MSVSELGEFGLIDLLAEMISSTPDNNSAAWEKLIIGIGDDAAVWQDALSVQLATTDSLVQDVHFRLDFISWRNLGWRAMAVNLSDIAAMGGIPRYALVSLSLPGSTNVDNVKDLYRGMIDIARQSGTAIIGGNMSSAPLVVINITVLGSMGDKNRQILTRSAAEPGDKIAVTGYLGGAAAGLEILKNKNKTGLSSAENLQQAFLRPYPRINEGQILVEKGVKAAIDISDGLIADLGHICAASRVGARISSTLVPIHPDARAVFGEEATEFALSGGEDYELLFTAPETVINSIREAVSCPVTVIGEIKADNAGEVILVDDKGNRIKVHSPGWRHF